MFDQETIDAIDEHIELQHQESLWNEVVAALHSLYESYSRGEWSNENVKRLMEAYDKWLG